MTIIITKLIEIIYRNSKTTQIITIIIILTMMLIHKKRLHMEFFLISTWNEKTFSRSNMYLPITRTTLNGMTRSYEGRQVDAFPSADAANSNSELWKSNVTSIEFQLWTILLFISSVCPDVSFHFGRCIAGDIFPKISLSVCVSV